ncbi:MAG: 8-oxoguanine deaminase [Clostridia bacterium]|nr:8-oxoguanine deaminase [Clostridia bacterium]
MKPLLLRKLNFVVTCNDQDEILRDIDILIEGPCIKALGKDLTPPVAAEVIKGEGMIAIPGLVNTHHHLYQALFRGLPEVQDRSLFAWLQKLYQFWRHLTPAAVYYGALVGFSELLRTGCTLTTDHHYVFPASQAGTLIDTEIQAAREIGIRFHPCRGSMSLGQSQGGLPPDEVVQKENTILKDSLRLIENHHDPAPYAMTRIALAPCSPFSVSLDLMRQSLVLAREKGVMLHTHLAETRDEEEYCRERYGRRPAELMEDLGWLGPDVWFAHAIHLNDREVRLLAGSGVAHCPSSNMKLGSGICRTSELFNAGVKLSIAVDGSASNDGSNMWEEMKRAYLLNHLRYGDAGLTAYQVLKLATRGGAEVLGRQDTGRLEAGKAADVVLINLDDIAFAGCHDPVVTLVCCGNSSLVDTTIVQGRIVARQGEILTVDVHQINHQAREEAARMIQAERSSS